MSFAATTWVFALLVLAGCGGSDNVAAVEVGERLKEEGVPFPSGVVDTTHLGDPDSPTLPPLMSTAYGETGSLGGIDIEVYDTADDRAEASARAVAGLEGELVVLTAECDTILVYAIIDGLYGDKSEVRSQRAEFVKVEEALAAAYDC